MQKKNPQRNNFSADFWLVKTGFLFHSIRHRDMYSKMVFSFGNGWGKFLFHWSAHRFIHCGICDHSHIILRVVIKTDNRIEFYAQNT